MEDYLRKANEAIGIATEEITAIVPTEVPQGAPLPTPTPNDDDKIKMMREELIKAAEREEISKTPEQIRKANKKVIAKQYEKYEKSRIDKANNFLTDMLISKYSDLLGGLEAIESSETLCLELKKDELLKRDGMRVAEVIPPYIQLLGCISGGNTKFKQF